MACSERIVVAALITGLGSLMLGSAGCGFRLEPDPEFVAANAAPGTRPEASQRPETQARSVDAIQRAEAALPDVARARAQPLGWNDGPLTRSAVIDRLLVMSNSDIPQVRANAIEGLERSPARAEPVVALAMSDPNPGVRSVAASVAGRAGLSGLAPTLRGLLGDESGFVRASAIGALRAIGTDADPTELSAMLLRSSDARLRSQAAFVIGEMGDPSAIPMLKQAWTTPIRNASEVERRLVRLQIAEALVKLGESDSIDAIRAALYPARPEELEATALAVQIIGQVRDRGSIDQLIYLSAEENGRLMPAEVRLAVAEALARMGMTEGGFLADEYRENASEAVRAQVAIVYGRTGRDEHLPKLRSLMQDPSELVRVAAAAGALDLLMGGATADAAP